MLCFLSKLCGVELHVLASGKHECFAMQILYVSVCVHSVEVLSAAFCMTFSVFIMVDDARGDHIYI